jgi:uncharacterized phiE125 gp8 family phage protein
MSAWYHRRDPYLEPRQPLWAPTLWGDLELVTPASGTIIQVSDVHAQARIDADITDEDTLISSLIVAAQSMVELSLPGHRQLLTATYNLPLMGWWTGPMRLPRPPLQSINAVTYWDSNNTLQTLSPSVYLVRTPWRQPGRIERAPFQWWPSHLCDLRLPISINFTAGYGLAAAVPQTLKQACLMLAAYWYVNRESALTQVPKEIEFSFNALLAAEGWGSYA